MYDVTTWFKREPIRVFLYRGSNFAVQSVRYSHIVINAHVDHSGLTRFDTGYVSENFEHAMDYAFERVMERVGRFTDRISASREARFKNDIIHNEYLDVLECICNYISKNKLPTTVELNSIPVECLYNEAQQPS